MRSARLHLFLAAAAIIGLGVLGTLRPEKDAGMAFLLGSLTLGGGFLICALFSLSMPWHGILGGGVLALLGFGRGALNAPGFAEYLGGSRERGLAPPMEMAVALICVVVLLRVCRAWSLERVSRMRDGT